MRRDIAARCGRFTTRLRLSAFIGLGRAWRTHTVNTGGGKKVATQLFPPVVNADVDDYDDDAADVSFSSRITVICDTHRCHCPVLLQRSSRRSSKQPRARAHE